MTDDEKKSLIKKLGSKKNQDFDARYSEENRKWFVDKIINSLAWQTTPAPDVETTTKQKIAASKAAVDAHIKTGFLLNTKMKKWDLYSDLTSRTQIIYGMIAMQPQFLDPVNAKYFDFILERRFRSIQRMDIFVNMPAKRKVSVFAYPEADRDTPEKMKVNKDSKDFWKGQLAGSIPFILTSNGQSNTTVAIENMFKNNKDTDRNLFACDPVATILHMDALLVAKDSSKLLAALKSQGDHYLKIDHPFGHFSNYQDGQRLVAITSAQTRKGDVEIPLIKVGQMLTFSKNRLTPVDLTTDAFLPLTGDMFMIVDGLAQESFIISAVNPVTKKIRVPGLQQPQGYGPGARLYVRRNTAAVFNNLYKALPSHFVSDSDPAKALFEQLSVKSSDLQVGDHVYVINHPLYKMYYPSGAWGGEHSFIIEIGTHDATLPDFRKQLKVEGHGLRYTLLEMGNDMVSWINTVLGVLQALTKIHLKHLDDHGMSSTPQVTVTQVVENNIQKVVFEYDVDYVHKLYREGGKKETVHGFVIKQDAMNPNTFQIFNANGHDATQIPVIPAANVQLLVTFIGTGSGDFFLPSKWAAPFFNSQTTQLETQPLFEADNKTPKLLSFDDLVKSKPFYVTDDVSDAYVTRPRVDFGQNYQSFLTTNGAI